MNAGARTRAGNLETGTDDVSRCFWLFFCVMLLSHVRRDALSRPSLSRETRGLNRPTHRSRRRPNLARSLSHSFSRKVEDTPAQACGKPPTTKRAGTSCRGSSNSVPYCCMTACSRQARGTVFPFVFSSSIIFSPSCCCFRLLSCFLFLFFFPLAGGTRVCSLIILGWQKFQVLDTLPWLQLRTVTQQ